MDATIAERHQAQVIGAGQSGLAASYHLARHGIEHVVLEAHPRVGDTWRSRYDSLRLYSPAKYDALPGLPFPLPGHAFPTGNQMADYLEAYAAHHALPVRTGTRVGTIRPAAQAGYVVSVDGRDLWAEQVVIACGPFMVPKRPDFAAELDPTIRQVHSAEYRNPSQLQPGPVLVVGASHSGADLAMELAAAGHQTYLSGRSHGQLPFSVDSRRGRVAFPVLRLVALHLLTVRTPIGRRMAPKVRAGGGPLLRHRRADLRRAGVEWTDARTVGVTDGKPTLADGRVLEVTNVAWCTGFRPDYSWIEPPIAGDDGWPIQERGVVPSAPGLYVLGIPFLFGFASMLVLGASRDAAFVASRIAAGAQPAAAEGQVKARGATAARRRAG